MSANLIFAPRFERQLNERTSLARAQNTIVRYGVDGIVLLGCATDEHLAVAILGQRSVDRALCCGHNAVSHCDILAIDHDAVPIGLQTMFDCLALGEDHQARCFAVEAMNDEDSVGGILQLDVVAEDRVCGFVTLLVGAHREQSVALVDNDNMLILKDDAQHRVVQLGSRATAID